MQTTLLGLAIALIVALLAALIGPIFVDWGQYRAQFEEHASRMAGQPVRIGGAIDVRLLPTPSIMMRDVEVGPRATPAFGAQQVRLEMSLGSLIGGEWRATSLAVEAPEVSVGLDREGRLTTRFGGSDLELAHISVDHLTVSDGRLFLEDAGSATRITLDKVAFRGEMRSLTDMIRGEGEFSASGDKFKYDFSSARRSDAGTSIRATLEPLDRPLTVQAEGLLSFDARAPKFEGTLALSRPAGAVLASGKAVAADPWRVSGRVKADSAKALFDKIEAQYGPNERSLHLSGTAELRLGAKPKLEAVLSARQVDLDRTLATSATPDRLPLTMVRAFLGTAVPAWRPAFPVSLGIGIDQATLGGGTLQNVRGDLSFADKDWSIDTLEFRAPGLTQVRLSGRTGGEPASPQFNGPFELESHDPGALMTWLEGVDRSRTTIGRFLLRGDMALGQEHLAIDQARGELDRKPFEGRIDYVFASADRRASLDASLSAAEFDLDGAVALVRAAGGGSSFERPGEVWLAVDLGRTTFGGVEALATQANIRLDGTGLNIERLSIAQLGGAAVNASGQIDLSAGRPHGSISLNVDAQKVDGLAALIEQFWPRVGAALKSRAAVLSPAKLEGTIAVDAPSTPVTAPADRNAPASGRLTFNGNLGGVNVVISGAAAGKLDTLSDADVHFDARMFSSDAKLLGVIGLDRLFAIGNRPATLTISGQGPASGDMRVTAGLNGDGLEASADGKLRANDASSQANLTVSFKAADMRAVRQGPTPLPLSLNAKASVSDQSIALTDVVGKLGDTGLRGKISLDLAGPPRLDGQVSVDAVDFPALIVAATGAPASPQGGWSTQNFAPLLPDSLAGRIELAAARATLIPAMSVRDVKATINLKPAEIGFGPVTANVGRGTLVASLSLTGSGANILARGRIETANADAQQLTGGARTAPVYGRISSQLDFDGSGSNPAALFGSLRGGGTLTLADGQIAGLDRKAIDVALRDVERGTPISAPRISTIVGKVMDTGSLSVPWATVPFEIAAGRVRFGQLVTSQPTSDLALTASIDLAERTIDARLTMYGVASSEVGAQRPEVTVALNGPLAVPRRSIDVSALVSWLTLQAVDRETKRLDAEAKQREKAEAALRQLEQQQEREKQERLERENQLRDNQANGNGPGTGEAAAPLAVPTGSVPRTSMPPPPGEIKRRTPRAVESAPLPLIPNVPQ